MILMDLVVKTQPSTQCRLPSTCAGVALGQATDGIWTRRWCGSPTGGCISDMPWITRRGARHAGPAPARRPGRAAADAQASQEAGLCTEIAGDRQAVLVYLGVPAIGAGVPSRTRAQNEQSGREFASTGATTRAEAATLQISPIRSAPSEYARCRPQHLQPPTPPRLAIDLADLQRRGGGAMVRSRRSSVRPDQPLPPFNRTPITVTKPAGMVTTQPEPN